MKIRLLDWASEEHYVEIPDNTDMICGCILSGDMILEYPIRYDTSDCRTMDFYDGTFTIRKENFHKLETMGRSYDVFDFNEG